MVRDLLVLNRRLRLIVAGHKLLRCLEVQLVELVGRLDLVVADILVGLDMVVDKVVDMVVDSLVEVGMVVGIGVGRERRLRNLGRLSRHRHG